MKNKLKLIIMVLVFLVIGYFGYKGYNLYLYTIGDNIGNTSADFKITNKITVKSEKSTTEDYLIFKNVKIKNDFKEFTKTVDSTGRTNIIHYLLKDDSGNMVKRFSIGYHFTYLDTIKRDTNAFGTNNIGYGKINREAIIKKYNIKNDMDLIKYIENNNNKQSNIFTSVKEMQENYFPQFLLDVAMPLTKNITLIDGDYQGYILNLDINYKEVDIIKDNKRYALTFYGEGYSNDYIKELLKTLVID